MISWFKRWVLQDRREQGRFEARRMIRENGLAFTVQQLHEFKNSGCVQNEYDHAFAAFVAAAIFVEECESAS